MDELEQDCSNIAIKMDELEQDCAKGNLIANTYYFYVDHSRTNVLANFIGVENNTCQIYDYMHSKTIDEVIDIIIKLSKQDKWSDYCHNDRIKYIIKNIKN